jgi:ArsR family transcriptional regulator, arsenate/arsenite/antimonite-responsive transcriptional repressor
MLISVHTDLLSVFADPLRFQIVTLLARETMCASHLMEETGARQTNLSNHLRILREAGVLDTEPCGRFTYYKLRPDILDDLAGSFAELAAVATETIATDRKRPCP